MIELIILDHVYIACMVSHFRENELVMLDCIKYFKLDIILCTQVVELYIIGLHLCLIGMDKFSEKFVEIKTWCSSCKKPF